MGDNTSNQADKSIPISETKASRLALYRSSKNVQTIVRSWHICSESKALTIMRLITVSKPWNLRVFICLGYREYRVPWTLLLQSHYHFSIKSLFWAQEIDASRTGYHVAFRAPGLSRLGVSHICWDKDYYNRPPPERLDKFKGVVPVWIVYCRVIALSHDRNHQI